MLLFPNERAQVQDNYHRIPISCGGGISYEIKSYEKNGNIMTAEQVDKIAETVLANHKVQRTFCTVKCEEIIADYAKLMVQIEAASNEVGEDITKYEASEHEEEVNTPVQKEIPWFKRVDWGSVAAGVAAIVIPGLVSAVASYKK